MAKKTAAAVTLVTMKAGFLASDSLSLYLQDSRINDSNSSVTNVTVTFDHPRVGATQTPLRVVSTQCFDGYLIVVALPPDLAPLPQNGFLVLSLTVDNNGTSPSIDMQGVLEAAFYAAE